MGHYLSLPEETVVPARANQDQDDESSSCGEETTTPVVVQTPKQDTGGKLLQQRFKVS